MAVSPQEKARPAAAFSLRHSLTPALSMRRRNNSTSKVPASLDLTTSPTTMPPKLDTHRLPPLSTSFPISPSKSSITTTTISVSPIPAEIPGSSTTLPGDACSAAMMEKDCSTPSTPKITVSTFAVKSEFTSESGSSTSYERGRLGGTDSDGGSKPSVDAKSDAVSHPWNSTSRLSRSPSPSSRDDTSSRDDEGRSTKASSVSSISPTNGNETPGQAKATTPTTETPESAPPPTPKLSRSNTLGKRARRLSLFGKNVSPVEQPPAPPPPIPKTISVDRPLTTASSGSSSFKKVVKDEMWEAFKALDADYQKFSNKSAPQKTTIVRQNLLPFLQKHYNQTSSNISPEILERRVRTLHRWWTGLIAQLRNRSPQMMPGGDRPVYLGAISYIMSRPEWRSPPSTFAPLAQRQPLSAKSESSASLCSATSDFSVQKSVQHNIKVLFTRTLFDTLAYVVERMGVRSAPLGLVTFGGKVLAYAFFYCAGVAEMLISLWGLKPDLVRRVPLGFGIGRCTDLRHVAEDVVSEFPETLQPLGFTSMALLMRKLRQPVKVPIGNPVEWFGPWLNRWCGRDGGLLHVFIREYHVLMFEYMSPDATRTAQLCAPGYIHVLAQMLSMIDNTIHRSANPETATSSTTFEDIMNATATLPLAARNTAAARTMAENKLIVLLREVLFDSTLPRNIRECVGTAFSAMLKAAVQKISMFDGDGCFQLCELMEEVMPILSQAELQGLGNYIDWNFWLGVTQTMLGSVNNMTELRVLTFVYTIWPMLVADDDRKRIVCIDWLLSEPMWDRLFCHWCPIVRAYYMRLMCWRLGRYDGDASEVDIEVLKTMLLRLRTGYAQHLQLKKAYEDGGGGKPSSTASCLPAPGRRIVILRNDIATGPPGTLLDGMVPTFAPFVATPGSLLQQVAATASVTSLTESEAPSESSAASVRSDEAVTPVPRRWSIRSVFGFKPVEKKETPPAPVAPAPVEKPKLQAHFKFSLEWVDRPQPSRERVLGLSRLPAPAQRYLDSLQHGFPVVEDPPTGATAATYIGRALAEWIQVIVEHESFFDRRKAEGRETDKDVETPALFVDNMRRF